MPNHLNHQFFEFADVTCLVSIPSTRDRQFYTIADVAQLVEHFLGKEEVTGSIPVISSVKLVCNLFAGVTQLVESQPSKLLVAGSSPVSRSGRNEKKNKALYKYVDIKK
jgi:hypothetical protein